jgi:hypothetical protein
MHLFLSNNIKIEGFLVWLVLDPIKFVKYGVFVLKVMSHFTLHQQGILASYFDTPNNKSFQQ